MTIHEPATLATDCVLAAIAAWLAHELRTQTSPENFSARWWVSALRLTAMSAFIGGTYHGFAPNLSGPVVPFWWFVTLWFVILTSAAMTIGWVHAVVRPSWRKPGFRLVVVKLAAFAVLAAFRPTFLVVIVDYGSSLLLWLGAALVLRRPWSGWMRAAIALSIVAALVQQLHLAPAPWFNHNDLYHVIQACGLAAFYRAALCLVPSAPSVP